MQQPRQDRRSILVRVVSEGGEVHDFRRAAFVRDDRDAAGLQVFGDGDPERLVALRMDRVGPGTEEPFLLLPINGSDKLDPRLVRDKLPDENTVFPRVLRPGEMKREILSCGRPAAFHDADDAGNPFLRVEPADVHDLQRVAGGGVFLLGGERGGRIKERGVERTVEFLHHPVHECGVRIDYVRADPG